MNREIKFRGKDVTGVWRFGNLHIDECVHDPSKNTYYIIRRCFVPAVTMPSRNYIEVDPKTVGQYLGISCNKGEHSYIGDIVESDGKIIILKDLFEVGYMIHECTLIDGDYTKLGNIHDNPDLNA